jgi:hypothetical protein
MKLRIWRRIPWEQGDKDCDCEASWWCRLLPIWRQAWSSWGTDLTVVSHLPLSCLRWTASHTVLLPGTSLIFWSHFLSAHITVVSPFFFVLANKRSKITTNQLISIQNTIIINPMTTVHKLFTFSFQNTICRGPGKCWDFSKWMSKNSI